MQQFSKFLDNTGGKQVFVSIGLNWWVHRSFGMWRLVAASHTTRELNRTAAKT